MEYKPSELTLEALCADMKHRGVSIENLPERLEVRTSLPRGSGGKVAKQLLREEVRALAEQESASEGESLAPS